MKAQQPSPSKISCVMAAHDAALRRLVAQDGPISYNALRGTSSTCKHQGWGLSDLGGLVIILGCFFGGRNVPKTWRNWWVTKGFREKHLVAYSFCMVLHVLSLWGGCVDENCTDGDPAVERCSLQLGSLGRRIRTFGSWYSVEPAVYTQEIPRYTVDECRW